MNISAEGLGVSRETFERLETFATLLRRWNPKINLVAKSTIKDLWSRHILDSLQVWREVPAGAKKIVDLGSGGGFPGLVIAICAADERPDAHVKLVESDTRKVTFLRTVLRETDVAATVIAKRIEAVDPINADIITARALTELSGLLGFAKRHLAPSGCCLFPKGKNWRDEIQSARQAWDFSYDAVSSKTDPQAVILRIEGLSRV